MEPTALILELARHLPHETQLQAGVKDFSPCGFLQVTLDLSAPLRQEEAAVGCCCCCQNNSGGNKSSMSGNTSLVSLWCVAIILNCT